MPKDDLREQFDEDVKHMGTYGARKRVSKSYKGGRRDKAKQREETYKRRKEAREWQERLGHLY